MFELGLDCDVLDTGCCGLAGSFGYEAGERYEVSVQAGEKLLLPRVHEASPHTLILTDGFSCRSQIEHGSKRSALHLAQAVQMAMKDGPNGPATALPESLYAQAPAPSETSNRRQATVAAGATATLGGLGALATRRLRRRS